MIHPHTELRQISPEVGLGVVATRLIPRGSILWIDCHLDQKLTPKQVAAMPASYKEVLDRYGYPDLKGRTVLCWDNGRFVNHSCDPSGASGPATECEFALRDIHPGEQWTCDYLEIRSPDTFPCRCGAELCRSFIRWEDKERVEARLHAMVNEVLPLVSKVEQPLARFADHLPEVQALLAGLPLPTTKATVQAKVAKSGAAKNGAAKNGAAKSGAQRSSKNGAAKKPETAGLGRGRDQQPALEVQPASASAARSTPRASSPAAEVSTVSSASR